ncbi:aconitate hydratase 1 [Betaproteobacteria bacterium GR16-43]|nr:aconitate hydratase 1 [Betaproteobacteria bacterium GR16-43]
MHLVPLAISGDPISYFSVDSFAREAGIDVRAIPGCLRILAENALRHVGHNGVTASDVEGLLRWNPAATESLAVPFHPARVLMQDYTGIPSLVDLAALRDAMQRQGHDPSRINPQIPVDLVIDHSLIVDTAGRPDALSMNLAREFERNAERYQLARWAQRAFDNLRVVPPGNGILHQVNIERIAQVVRTQTRDGTTLAYPDTMVGTDSHSTMVNGLGVLGWGVGGIEAEAAMLGLPLVVPLGRIVGVRLTGALREGITATDLVLSLTQVLRAFGVIDSLVEFFGPALASLPVSDRVTLANMAPEFGSTCALFPIDAAALRYLELTGRDARQVALVEAYARAQGLWREPGHADPAFSAVVAFDLSSVEPTVAGPRKPHARVALGAVAKNFREEMNRPESDVAALSDGAIVIAAITSCTNTSNPAVMLAAGLLARKAVARGLTAKPWVKTSLTPGSLVVGRYLEASGLQRDLDALGFHVAGYGCATCGGMSGELDPAVDQAIRERDLVACAVLSGNRNFEARIHPLARANYLMSPPLVVAYAIAGHVGIDLTSQPLGLDRDGKPVFLGDLWPSNAEVAELSASVLSPGLFEKSYAALFDGGPEWAALEAPVGTLFPWAPDSTYIRRPPYLDAFEPVAASVADIVGARALLMLGDAITTDHISPVGSIAAGSPAALHLRSRGVASVDFNAYGARRANHEVMVRGTFANIRLKNELAGGREGGITRHVPSGEVQSVFDAAERYAGEGVPLVIIAGSEYGAGSSRDWAAKGSALLGVRAVIAESFERIHRSNLVMMGILPLAFPEGVTRQSLRLDGSETFDLAHLARHVAPRAPIPVRIRRADGSTDTIEFRCRIETPNEHVVWASGGMMPFVLRRIGAAPHQEAA